MKIYTYQGKKNVSGEKIRQMRNMKRMSQSALAAKMQVEGVMLERDSISRIEGGERFVADYDCGCCKGAGSGCEVAAE